MWYPGQAVSQEVIKIIVAALNNDEVKAELSKRIRIEIDNERIKRSNYNGNVQSYESLTDGNVNMQAKMAASGYDVYGRTIIQSNNHNATNHNVYKKMKNQIRYGRAPQEGYRNRGGFSIV